MLPLGGSRIFKFFLHIIVSIWTACFAFKMMLSLFSSLPHLQSSKVSHSPMRRLTRKDRSRRGQESAPDRNLNDRLHVSDATCGSSRQPQTIRPQLVLSRNTLLFEDQLDRDCVSSCPDLNKGAPVSGPRSVLLHQTADKEPALTSPPSPCGQFSDFYSHTIMSTDWSCLS